MSTVTINRHLLDVLIAETGGVAKAAVDDTLDEMALGMHQRVHIITGKTDESITVDHAAGTVSASYGAVFEVERGGAHDFMTPAFNEGMTRVYDKVTAELRRVMGGL